MTTLRDYGIHVVGVGEAESLVRSVGNHWLKWVNEAIKKNLQTDSELDPARKFVSQIIGSGDVS